ncbi:MAG: histidine--tRNA ligase [Candidatus Theseobacter exili]|nr:histidine--tRNA ligase [Candidatus Theseobacter exili]
MSNKSIKAIKGTFDILPSETPLWTHIEEVSRKTFEQYGFEEMRTPVFEATELFVRSIGEVTDIVQKEMYTFTDPGERSLTLRPEGTAPVVRAYLEHRIHVNQPFVKYYYIGPMFRRERPQAGRTRQFHQVGVEAIGSDSPGVDVETIALAYRLFVQLGIDDVSIRLNSVGCKPCKENYSGLLRKFLKPRISELCNDCKQRIDRNVFRVLDCKETACRKVVAEAPSILDSLCKPCSEHFDEVCKLLENIDVPVNIDPRLVRGLDYYTRTVFELNHSALGAKDAVGAGGRYDNLIEEMGGPAKPAIGFAIGLERTIMILKKKGADKVSSDKDKVYLISLGQYAFELNFKLLEKLRRCGINASMDPEPRSTKAQMRAADRIGAAIAIIRGDREIEEGVVMLRDMRKGNEDTIRKDNVIDKLLEKLQGEN